MYVDQKTKIKIDPIVQDFSVIDVRYMFTFVQA